MKIEVIKDYNTISINDIKVNKTFVSLLNGKYRVLVYNGMQSSAWGLINNTDRLGLFGPKDELNNVQNAINYILEKGGKVFQFDSIDEALRAGLN